MTTRQPAGQAGKLLKRYLAELDTALQGLPAPRREEIASEVESHIEEGLAGIDPDDEASVRTLLLRVGDPAAIAAEAGAPPAGGGRSERWDAWVPWLIVFGGVASGLGWVAAMVLLWSSNTWSRREKWIATLVPMAGALTLVLGGYFLLLRPVVCTTTSTAAAPNSCTPGSGVMALVVLLLVAGLFAYLLPPIQLARHRRQRPSVFA